MATPPDKKELLEKIEQVEALIKAEAEEAKEKNKKGPRTAGMILLCYFLVLALIAVPFFTSKQMGLTSGQSNGGKVEQSVQITPPSKTFALQSTDTLVIALIADVSVANNGTAAFTYDLTVKLSAPDGAKDNAALYNAPVALKNTSFSLLSTPDSIYAPSNSGSISETAISALTGGQISAVNANTAYFATSGDGMRYTWHTIAVSEGNTLHPTASDSWTPELAGGTIQFLKIILFVDLSSYESLPDGFTVEQSKLVYHIDCTKKS